eukprot:1537648-Rhodomonas_salina.1
MTWSDLISAARLPGDDVEMFDMRGDYGKAHKLKDKIDVAAASDFDDKDNEYENDSSDHDDKRLFVPKGAGRAMGLLRFLNFDDSNPKKVNDLGSLDLDVEKETSKSAKWLMYFLSRPLTKEM